MYLHNLSLYYCYFPTQWKSIVIPAFPKEGNTCNPGNWWPINSLCLPGKLFEKYVYKQVRDFSEKNGLLMEADVIELPRKPFSNMPISTLQLTIETLFSLYFFNNDISATLKIFD